MTTDEKLTELYAKRYKKFVNRVKYRVGGEVNAEDVVEEAFANALQYSSSYDGSVPIENWFSTILHNAANAFRREEQMNGMTDNDEEEEGTDTLDNIVFKEEMANTILNEIEKIESPETRKILHSYIIKGWKTREIATWSTLSHSHIRVLIHRFKADMSDKYGQDMCS